MLDLVPQFSNTMEMDIEFFQKLALATFIGILIGIEREHRRLESVELIAGVRSFTISCIAGMISSYLTILTNPGVLLISLAFFAVISAIYAYMKNIVLKQPGITGPIALYCTFLLGVLITYNRYLIAIVGAVVLTLLLAEKRPLHSFATNLTDDEIQSAVRFLAVVFILFPLAPEEPLYGIINLRWILLVVIMVSTISFISFLILRNVGARYGLPLSGVLGGLVNSEATAGAIAAMTKRKKELTTSGYIGVTLSNASMLVRNLLVAFIVDPSGSVLLLMLPPQLLITALAVGTVLRSKDSEPVGETIRLESPFALSSAIKFAFGFTALSIFSAFANSWAGAAGVYATALGGFVSSAVVTASATALAAGGHVSYGTAALTAVLAGIVGTANKILLVKWSGSPELAELIKRAFWGFIIFGTTALVIWGIFITYAY